MLIPLLIALFIIGADQLTKLQIVRVMQPGQDIPVIDGILHLHYAQNTGAAFSFLDNQAWGQWVFIIAAACATVAVLVFLAIRKKPLHWLALVSLGLIMGGAVGNLIDRIRIHHVIDFVYVKVINFAIFNVADASISVGAVLLCIYLLFIHDRKKAGSQPEPDHPEETVGHLED